MRAAIKSIITDARNTVRDHGFFDFLVCPRRRVTCVVFIAVHIAGAADGQRPLAVQRPGQAAAFTRRAAGAAAHDFQRFRSFFAAAGAGISHGAVLFRSGRLNHVANVPRMAESGNLAGKGLIAARLETGSCLRAGLGARGLFFSGPFPKVMHGCIFSDGFIAAFNRHVPPCIIRAKKVNIFQTVTVKKCITANIRNGVRNCDALQTPAAIKCLIFNLGNTFRDRDLCQIGAFGKCISANTGDALRDRDLRQIGTSGKCIIANTGDALRDSKRRVRPARGIGHNHFLIFAVYDAAHGAVIRVFLRNGNVCQAGTPGKSTFDKERFTRDLDVGQGGAAGKSADDCLNTVRECHSCQCGAIFKCTVHAGHAARNRDTGQGSASRKSIFSDFCNTVRNRHIFQIVTAAKSKTSNARNAVINHNRLDVLSRPRCII